MVSTEQNELDPDCYSIWIHVNYPLTITITTAIIIITDIQDIPNHVKKNAIIMTITHITFLQPGLLTKINPELKAFLRFIIWRVRQCICC